jgi:hypothetical protein
VKDAFVRKVNRAGTKLGGVVAYPDRNPRCCHWEGNMDNTTLIIIIIVVLLIGGGGWYGRGRWY